MKPLAVWLVLVCVLTMAGAADAHPVPFSYLDIRIQPSAIEVLLVAHVFDLAHDLGINPPERLLEPGVAAEQADAIRKLLGPRLELGTTGSPPLIPEWSAPEVLADRQSLRMRLRYAIASPSEAITLSASLFPYDTTHQTFVNVYEHDELATQRILDRAHPRMEYFAGTSQSAIAVIRRFVPAGIHHILIGPDHLLFLFGLLLLGGSIRQLLLIVTSFTLAHSVTLTLAALNILSPPARIIEPAIALSIVYVGADNILAKGGRDVRAWIALTFGFIHGFGFASVLREMELPQRALGWSLFSFNFGVEIGQMLVVVAVATVLGAIRSQSERAGRQVAFAGSIVVIVAGVFWFVQRVFFPGGI
jgi:hydrogenase/urease accessory protein HupE